MVVSNIAIGQISDPVSWDSKAEKISDTEYNLIFTATLDDGWYLYSQFLGDDGPIPTSFDFGKNANVQLVGKTTETGTSKKEGYDELFDMNLVKFGGTATFTQKVTVSKEVDKISGALTYMTCDEMRCLPPEEVTFEIKLK
ncbi:MAG: thiol:disulfide interchange protein DsbD [Saprospiraceae bacterium]|jgi:thiol:disulfide interchange protein DsbD